MNILHRMFRQNTRYLPFRRYLLKAVRRGHVAMIHIGRSGSTVLGQLLKQHPLITWDGEIYQRIFRERERKDHSLPPIADVDPVDYLKKRSESVFGCYYGFETKFFHIRSLGTDLASYIKAIDDRVDNMRFLVLERKNTLRTVISTLVARQTGTWHIRGSVSPPPNRVYVDVNSVFVNRMESPLVDLLEEFARDFRELEYLLDGRPSLHLTYEEDVAKDPQHAYRRICEYLDIPSYEATVDLSRTNPYPLRELIKNFDEISSALKGSHFEWMLEEE